MKRELKKPVVYSLYGISLLLLIAAIVLPISVSKNELEQEFDFVSKGILDYENNIKVVNQEKITTISKPFNDETIKIVKKYYDYKDSSENQEDALIYFEGTYMQSSGVAYSNGASFDVVSILDGTVDKIEENETMGNIITITHDNGIVSIYQSISDIVVSEGEKVNQGQLIAKSSTSNISVELDNHLYFELIVNGESVNPENYYGKNPNEL